MANSSSNDPADAIRKAITALEGRIDSMSTAVFGTEQFARGANVANTMSTRVKKGVSDHMGRQLAIYNMPSREDVTALGERIMSVEDRLVNIENMLLQLMPKASGAKKSGPPRTKKPPSKSKAKSKK